MKKHDLGELRETVTLWEENNRSTAETARQMGVTRRGMRRRLQKARQQGLIDDVEPMYLKRRSTLSDGDGNTKLIWHVEAADADSLNALANEALDAIIDGIKPIDKIAKSAASDRDTCSIYNIGDAHLGMYGWRLETGEDFDVSIAEADLCSAIDRLVDATPASDLAIINNLGDWFHADDSRSVTPASGNRLDTDSRWPKVVRVGVRTQRYICEKVLSKHKRVLLVNIAGNHDPHAVMILNEAMRMLFDKNPALTVEDTSRYMWWTTFGKSLIGVCHGDKAKPQDLPGVLAVDAREAWGQSDYRYIYHGHFHSRGVIEHMDTVVECFRTLAAKDKWHADYGYRSGREMQAIVLHKEYGEIERHIAGLKLARSKQGTPRPV